MPYGCIHCIDTDNHAYYRRPAVQVPCYSMNGIQCAASCEANVTTWVYTLEAMAYFAHNRNQSDPVSQQGLGMACCSQAGRGGPGCLAALLTSQSCHQDTRPQPATGTPPLPPASLHKADPACKVRLYCAWLPLHAPWDWASLPGSNCHRSP